jgi:hypothetical protein
MKRRCLSLAFVGLCGLLATTAHAQVTAAPSLMNFQGRLTKPDGTPVANGTYALRFSLWDAASGGTEKWSQTINSVTVTNGTFSALLSPSTAGLFNGNLWLEIKIGSNAPLTPRQQIVSVAYAMKANSVPDGSITSGSLLDGTITGADIANGSITGDKLASNVLNNVWKLGGNSGAANTYIGTLDDNPLRFFTNFTQRMSLEANGNLILQPSTKIGIGTGNVPGARLDVRGSGGVHIFAGDGAPFGSAAIQTHFNAPATHAWFAEAGNRIFSVAGGGQGYFAGNVGIGVATPLARLDVNGAAAIRDNNMLEFGAGVVGKQVDAGKIGYKTYSDGLDIIGAGTNNINRKIQFWNEGGATFTGAITAPSATIPALNGNVAVSGAVTAQVVTVLGGSDVAEPYNVAPAGEVKAIPGYVVAIDPDKVGQMRVVSKAYDTTVAGIVSGANGINPGITLRQKGTVADGELPVASIGRVWCWCDADASGPIVAGDLLTTSDTPGHAMKAVDKERRDGAVIGKAMSSLKSGKGLVLVLVSLK